MKNFKYWCFVTLTYNPGTLESGFYIADTVDFQGQKVPLYSLSKRDFKLFVKRVKKNYGKPLKYFLCGEYGSRTLRPHGHCIFLFDDPLIISVIQKAWKYGFTFFTRNLTTGLKYNEKSYELNNALSYTCKYACKRSSHPFFYDDKGNWREDLAEKPFRLMSKSLGESYIFSPRFARAQRFAERYDMYDKTPQDIEEFFTYPKPTRNGTVNVPLPRYYSNKLTKIKCIDNERKRIIATPDCLLHEAPYESIQASPLGSRYKAYLRVCNKRRLQMLLTSGLTESQALEQLAGYSPQQIALCQEKLQRRSDDEFNKSMF